MIRLICPNCGAQYEVADDAIPEVGRDVQCSNCGHTWFESPGASVAAEEELLGSEPAVVEEIDNSVELPEAADTDDISHEPQDAEPEAAWEDQEASDDESGPDGSDIQEPEEPAAPPSTPVRHELEDSLADILREEAEREQSARLEENSPALETQPDLPVDEPIAATKSEGESRIARLRGENAAAIAALTASEASRKEALPNIDEISDTLRSNVERGEKVAPAPDDVIKTKRKGFRWGFWSIILLILIAVLVYLFADQIIASVPAVEGPVTSYVGVIDGLRGNINGLAETAADSLQGEETASE